MTILLNCFDLFLRTTREGTAILIARGNIVQKKCSKLDPAYTDITERCQVQSVKCFNIMSRWNYLKHAQTYAQHRIKIKRKRKKRKKEKVDR